MPAITGLDNLVRKRNVAVLVDGEPACELSRKFALELGLRLGMDVDKAWLVQIARQDNIRSALQRAMRLLEIRSRGSQELKRALKQRGFDAEVIDDTIERLAKMGAIDDTQFAVEFIASRGRAHSQSVRRTRSELTARGVAKDDIDGAIAGVGEIDELGLARAALARRVRTLPEERDERQNAYRRLAAFLAGRGFSWNIVRKALDEVFSPVDSGEED